MVTLVKKGARIIMLFQDYQASNCAKQIRNLRSILKCMSKSLGEPIPHFGPAITEPWGPLQRSKDTGLSWPGLANPTLSPNTGLEAPSNTSVSD